MQELMHKKGDDEREGDAWLEECGLKAIFGDPEVSRLCYLSLRDLQHRGQEGEGIITANEHRLFATSHFFCKFFCEAGHCQCARAMGLSVPRNGLMVRVESQLRASGLSAGASEGSGEVWCGLCGDRRGWCTCGRCMGEGGFPTRPGLAGLKGEVGWARCKTCFGQTLVPCLFCGISEATNPVEARSRTYQATSPSKPQAV